MSDQKHEHRDHVHRSFRTQRAPIDFMGGPLGGQRIEMSYPFADVAPVADPDHSEPVEIAATTPAISAAMPRVGIYALARYGYGGGRGARFVYQWEGWQ